MFDIDWWYENFRKKYGFEGGEAVPLHAERVRELLIEAINAGLGEQSEVVAYPADGHMHNPFFILYRKRGSEAEEDLPEPPNVGEILPALSEAAYLSEVLTARVVTEVEPPEVREEMLADAFREMREGVTPG